MYTVHFALHSKPACFHLSFYYGIAALRVIILLFCESRWKVWCILTWLLIWNILGILKWSHTSFIYSFHSSDTLSSSHLFYTTIVIYPSPGILSTGLLFSIVIKWNEEVLRSVYSISASGQLDPIVWNFIFNLKTISNLDIHNWTLVLTWVARSTCYEQLNLIYLNLLSLWYSEVVLWCFPVCCQ